MRIRKTTQGYSIECEKRDRGRKNFTVAKQLLESLLFLAKEKEEDSLQAVYDLLLGNTRQQIDEILLKQGNKNPYAQKYLKQPEDMRNRAAEIILAVSGDYLHTH